MLGHKLKHTKIKVIREYDRGLPKLTVRGSDDVFSTRILASYAKLLASNFNVSWTRRPSSSVASGRMSLGFSPPTRTPSRPMVIGTGSAAAP